MLQAISLSALKESATRAAPPFAPRRRGVAAGADDSGGGARSRPSATTVLDDRLAADSRGAGRQGCWDSE
jgi:hypothetical protein